MKKIFLPILFILSILYSPCLNAQVTFTVTDDQSCGASISVPVTVSSFSNMTALQYTMEWDETELDFVSVSDFGLADLDATDFGSNNANTGVLTLAWIDQNASGETLPDGTVIYNINFNVLGANGNTSLIEFTNAPTSQLAATGFPPTVIPMNTNNGTMTVGDAQMPDLICPADLTTNPDPGVNTAIVNGIAPTASDNCNLASVTFNATGVTSLTGNNDASGETFNQGVTTLSYTATDDAGNSNNCSFDITVTQVNTDFVIRAESASADCDETSLTIPVSVENFDNLMALSFTLEWDEAVIDFNAVGNFNLQHLDLGDFGTTDTANGKMTMSWIDDDASGESVADGTNLFEITFDILGTSGTSSAIQFTDNPTDIIAAKGFPPVTVTIITESGTATINTDNEVPQITGCPTNMTINTGANDCDATATWTSPTITDNCPSLTVTNSHNSGDVFPIGTTTVSYDATDASGNNNNCSFDIIIVDNILPTISNCPSNIIQNTDPGLCDATISWTAPTAFDNCPITSFNSNFTSGNSFPVGITTVTYTASDNSGNQSSCSFDIQISDNELPTISNCPNNISQNVDLGLCDATVTWAAPTAFDNCPIATFQPNLSPGNAFPVGITTITYTATDGVGNQATCNFDIEIIDNELPTISNCPNNISQNVDLGLCDATVTWAAPTALDNCPIATFQPNLSPGNAFPVGITTITYTATDDAGNQATCNFDIEIIDNELPTISNCPTNISQNVDPGLCDATITWAAPTALDNCPIASFQSDFSSGNTFPVGITTVTYTATDDAGNQATCNFDIEIIDNELPTISNCPTNISQNIDTGLCDATITWAAPTAFDNCPIASFQPDFSSGDVFPVGTTTVTYTALDGSGNQATCSFDIQVVDNEAPAISNCPTDQTIVIISGCDTTATWISPTATDNCPGLSFNTDFNSGDTFTVGATTVTYKADDAAGNSTLCNFTITVSEDEAPVITGCPGDISQSASIGVCEAIVSWTPPVASDNCSGLAISANYNPGDLFPVGIHAVTFTATDASGNVTLCDFNVTVSDDEPPSVNCPADLTINLDDPNSCEVVVDWMPPLLEDNCPGANLTSTHNPGDTFFPGDNPVSYFVMDIGGNTGTCTFNILIIDEVLPTIDNCPTNITKSIDLGSCEAVVSWTEPTATDNCTITSFGSNINSGSIFQIGTSQIIYEAIDIFGNASTCTFEVTIKDDEFPVFADCPLDFTVANDLGLCSAQVTWTAPIATDNCSGLVVTSNQNPGDILPVGIHQINYNAEDASGNQVTCSFTISVQDTELPSISCPNNIEQNIDGSTMTATLSGLAPNASDNCNVDAITFQLTGATIGNGNDDASGSLFNIGETILTYFATDEAGNSTDCSTIINIIQDACTELSLVDCPNSMTLAAATGECEATVSWTPPTVDSNCPDFFLTSTHLPDESFLVGSTVVQYTVLDSEGNVDQCEFEITVQDTEIPSLMSCPDIITEPSLTGECQAIVNWATPSFDDNCGIVDVVFSHAPASIFSVGTTIVKYTAFDAAGNTAECNFNVIVQDDQFPVIFLLPDDIVQEAEPGSCSAIVNWQAPQVSENCGISAFFGTQISGSSFDVGETEVVYSATDLWGNTTIETFTITIEDKENPQMACPENISVSADGTVLSDPSNFLLNATPQDCSHILIDLAAFSASDNCGAVSISQTDDSSYSSGSIFPMGATSLEFTAMDDAGNTTVCSFSISVQSVDMAMANTSDMNPCVGEEATLSVNEIANATYTWFDPSGTSISNDFEITLNNIQLSQNGVYMVQIALPTCMMAGQVEISVGNNPSLELSSNDLLCNDGTADLMLFANDLAAANVTAWQWQFPNGDTSNDQNPVIQNPGDSEEGTYTLIATTDNGCTAMATTTVEISEEPMMPTLVANDNALCLNESITLTGQQFNGMNVQYIWEATPLAGSGLLGTGANIAFATPNIAGDYTYSFQVIVDGCISETATLAVNVEEAPQLDIEVIGDLACVDGTTSITLQENNGQATSYTWQGLTTGFSSNETSPVINNITTNQSDTYTLTASTANGCESSENIVVNITDQPADPNPLAASPDAICANVSPTTITGTSYPGNVIYNWTGDNLPVFANQTPAITINSLPAGNYDYTFSATINGCTTNEVQTAISVEDPPALNLSMDGETNCVNGDSDLTLFSGNASATDYTWTNSAGLILSNTEDLVLQNISSEESDIYTVVVSSLPGCTNSAQLPIEISDGLPAITAWIDGVSCEDEELSLMSDFIIGATYLWTKTNGDVLSADQNPTINPASTILNGTYTVTASIDDCTTTSAPLDVDILVAPDASDDIIDVLVDTPMSFDVSQNDITLPNLPFTITVLQDVENGSLENLGNGLFTYFPENGATTDARFLYEICYDDCASSCDIGFVSLVVNYAAEDCVATTLITPNEDGINDAFVISCIEVADLPNNELVIFNQWGDQVYEAAPYNNDWTGTFKDKSLPDGTYYFIFKRTNNSKPEKGFVTIYR